MINRLDADLVAIVGDLVDGTRRRARARPPRRCATCASRYGSFFVTGNHEYYSGVEEWVEEVDRLGLRVLRNERRGDLARAGLDLAGVNDVAGAAPFGDGPRLRRARSAAGTRAGRWCCSRTSRSQAHEAARHGVDLQLSGHTHGGQMVPFNLLVRAGAAGRSRGLGEVDGTPGLRHQRRRLLGPAGPGRRAAADHPGRAAHRTA